MKKLTLSCFLFVAFLFQLKAQTPASPSYNKVVFAEAFGLGLQGSLNYDMRLKKGRQDGLGFRLGVGGIFTGTSDADAGPVSTGVLAFPFGINYLAGEKRSAFEAGLGLSPQYVKTDLLSPTKPKTISENGWSTNGFINLGYRFQPLSNGFVFRFNWTPIISSTGFLPSYFGVSAGYGFK